MFKVRGSVSKALVAAVGALMTLSLGACGALPTSGPVSASRAQIQTDLHSVQNAPIPTKDADQTVILRDFLAACRAGAFVANYDAARKFLTPEAAGEWKPESAIHLYPANIAPEARMNDPQHAFFTSPSRGTLTARGEFIPPAANETLSSVFAFAQDSQGQWRISDLPDGLILAQNTFQAAYSRRQLYFLTPDGSNLVPDVRWVPAAKAATYLTELLLAGPTQSLQDAVTTAFPQGTTLVSHTVAVVDGKAMVRLESPQVELSPREQSLLQWQLDRTLRQLSPIVEVAVSVNEAAVTAPLPQVPNIARRAVGIADSKLISLDTQASIHDFGADRSVTSLALFPRDVSRFAYVDGGSSLRTLNVSSGEDTQVFSGSNILAVQVDPWGYVWAITQDAPHAFTVIDPKGAMRQLPVTYSPNALTHFSFAEDGVRLLAYHRGDTSTLDLARVVRDGRGQPISLAQMASQSLAPDVTQAWTAWAGVEQPVALLQSSPEKPTTLLRLPIGAEKTQSAAPVGANALAASQTYPEVIVSDGAGNLFKQDSWRWLDMQLRAKYPVISN